MSLQTDAETIADLCSKIIRFEILRTELQQAGGSAINLVPGLPEATITLNAQQKQTLLAQEDAWKASVKQISAAW